MTHDHEPNADYYADDWTEPASDGLGATLQAQMAHTPWWALSLSVHLLVLIIILPMIHCQQVQSPKSIVLKTDLIAEPEQDLEEEKQQIDPSVVPKPEVPQEYDAVETHMPHDKPETDNDMDLRTAQGDEGRSDADLKANLNNKALGAGAGAGKLYGNRLGGGKRNAGGPAGAPGRKHEELGLKWLADHQSPSGKWDGDGFQSQCQSGSCSGVSKQGWVDPGLTGLATLAFLGAGHTHRYGRHKGVVKKALRYLMKIQAANGLIGGTRGHYMYNHAIATLAIIEAYGMTQSPLIRGAAVNSINYLVKAGNPGMAWRYSAGSGDNDVSVTGWAVMALKAAIHAKLPVSGMREAMDAARDYIESVTDDSYYVTGYRKCPPRGWNGPTGSRFQDPSLGVDTDKTHKATHSPTAIALMSRVFFGYSKKDPRVQGAASIVAESPPVWDTGGGGKKSSLDYYYWYYGTLAMFQVGGAHWKRWNEHMKTAIIDHQRKTGEERGSWDPDDAWGFSGGRVYATAINTLSLEIYYRYPRVFK